MQRSAREQGGLDLARIRLILRLRALKTAARLDLERIEFRLRGHAIHIHAGREAVCE